MSYSVEKLPGEPIVVSTMLDDFSVADHLPGMIDELSALFDSQPEPVYYISDVGHLSLNLEDILFGSTATARGQNPVLHHPNIKRTILVTSSKMIKLAVKGMNSEVFGNIRIDLFETVDEAFAYVREQLAV